jgi:hypothetical protein
MGNKIKVSNPNTFIYGIKLMDGVREMIVKPKSFVLLDEDEVYYLDSTSRTFRDGFLVIEDENVKEQMGQTEANPNVLSDEEIEKILKGNFLKMKSELGKIHVQHVLNRVAEIALTLDLPMSKLKFVQEITNKELL